MLGYLLLAGAGFVAGCRAEHEQMPHPEALQLGLVVLEQGNGVVPLHDRSLAEKGEAFE